MKKILLTLICVLCVVGCTSVDKGIYKEGTYFGSKEYESYGNKFVVTAVLTVDTNGKIASCFVDSTYTKDSVNTTKKTLGDAYGMKETSKNIGVIPGGAEWYEQVKVIEDKVVAEQNLDWVKWNTTDATKLDAVSGVTISATDYIAAIQSALEQAK